MKSPLLMALVVFLVTMSSYLLLDTMRIKFRAGLRVSAWMQLIPLCLLWALYISVLTLKGST